MAETLTHNDETLTLLAWSKRAGIAYTVLRWRIRHGWDAERILTPSQQQAEPQEYEAFGKRQTLYRWEQECGISYQLLGHRIRRGMTLEEAIKKGVRGKSVKAKTKKR